MSDNNTQTPVQPMDPNMTIEVKNEELEALLIRYAQEQNTEALNELVKHIHGCRVLVPANVNEDKKPTPCFIRNQEGKLFLPIYTSKNQLPKEPKSPAVMNVPYVVMNKLAVKEELKCDGIVINPFTNNLIFKAELVKRIEEVDSVQRKIPTGKTLKLSPQEYVLFERNQFEYRFFPKKFFEDCAGVVDALCEQKEAYIDALYEESYQQKRMYAFVEEDFSVMAMNVSEDLLIVRVDMPTHDMNANSCYRVYLTWNVAKQNGRYFMIEKSGKGEVLCELTHEWKHVNYGEAPAEGAELQKLIDLVQSTFSN